MDSLKVTDAASAAVATHPRVTLDNIKSAIAHTHTFTGEQAQKALLGDDFDCHASMKTLTICLIVMNNGFVVIGKAAPASPENFNAELGQKFAYEDAIRQLWPLMGFALRDRLHEQPPAKGA